MKKWLALVLVLLVAVSMMALAGCGDGKKKDDKDDEEKESVTTTVADGGTVTTTVQEATLIGAWKAEMGDLIEMLFGEDAVKDIGKAPLNGYYEFCADGTYKVYTKVDEIEATFASIKGKAVSFYTSKLDEPMDDSGITFREMLEDRGYDSVEALFDDQFSLEQAQEIAGISFGGNYTKTETTITLENNGETREITYVLSGNTLTLADESETITFTKA